VTRSSTSRGRARWTIAELSEQVVRALDSGGYQPPQNGQVRAVPDLRTIRYYTSIGLLDRPVEMRGRTALYGWRHLLQLCAIKRLQAEGRALGEVQAALAGLDDRALARVARVSGEALEEEVAEAPRRQEAFWAAAPAPARPAIAAPRIEQVAKLRLARGVQLEIASVSIARSDDAAALIRAAAPLLEELRRQGLLGDDPLSRAEGQEEPV
jgi:DNA-binding transcriptional MerR regulator